jgi:hypothetical protein
VAVGLTGGGRDRGGPAGAGELGAGEALRAGDLADQLRRRQRAAAALGEQLLSVGRGQPRKLRLELPDAGGARGDPAHEVARDPYPGSFCSARAATAGGAATSERAAATARTHPVLVISSGKQPRECRAHIEERFPAAP